LEKEKTYATQSKDGKTKYVFLFSFPGEKLLLKNVTAEKRTTVQVLGSNKRIPVKQTAQGLEIIIPETLKGVTDNVWVLKFQDGK